MFIRHLTLENFRCFKYLEIDFENQNSNRTRSIILGQNGTGKSNILKAIALVTAGSDALAQLLGNPDSWIKYGENICSISLVISTKKGEERNVNLEIHRNDTFRDVMQRADQSLDKIDRALEHAERNYFVVGYGASRGMPSNSRNNSGGNFSSPRAQCIGTLLDSNASLNSLTDWAIDLDYRNSGESLNIIRKVFDDFLPAISFHSIDKENYQLLVNTPEGVVSLNYLSDGYQNMAAWLGDLLYRVTQIFGDRKEPLNSSGVLLLDEIDLHLHPIWQRRLLQFIEDTLPNMQLIATTHSPFTAQQAKQGELFVIERKDDGLEINQFSGNPEVLLLHQLIMSDAFGLKTDVSLEVQKKQELRDELKQSTNRDPIQNEKLVSIEQELNEIPISSYPNSIITDDERAMMKYILKSYKGNPEGDA